MDTKDLWDFLNFLKNILKPNRYIIVIVLFFSYLEGYDAFHRSSLEFIPHPYKITYKLYSVQNRNPMLFTQNSTIFGLITYVPGKRDFSNENVKTPFNLIDCQSSLNYVDMYNVKELKSKLSHNNTKIAFDVN